ncbi:MAG: ferrochelatase [Gammaproteobacteria bacterium]|nr:ferrochelatase [Gammaproteobacteria bacterium]
MVNLGTPDAPETAPVRRYLAEFLSDPRIIELPRWLWRIILHGIILRVRPSKSAAAYREVWTEEGSPLLTISKKQSAALHNRLTEQFGDRVMVRLAMRYGSPSIDDVMTEMEAANVRRLVVLPMYPQYSGTTTASVFDAVTNRLQRTRWLPEVRFINQYLDEPGYIAALANSVKQHWQEHGRGDLLVTTYHGIPRRYLLAGDPYHCQCFKTTRMLLDALGESPEAAKVVFQSRVGREEWLRPYCDETMKTLPSEGVKNIDIMCPGFSADCLETIEEIEQENREYFIENGGENFRYIPCLNDSAEIIECLADLVIRHAQGWPEVDEHYDEAAIQAAHQVSADQARKLRESTPFYD